MKFKGVIFDMDGILFDTEKIWRETWHELADKYHVSLPDEFFKKITGSSGDYMIGLVRDYYHVADGQAVIAECKAEVRRKLDIDVPMKPGVHEILQYLRGQEVRLAVASSSPRFQIDRNLEKTGIIQYFDETVSGEEVKQGKPEPDVFLRAAEKIGCRPEECYVVEDSPNGIKAGYAAGCAVIMVPDLLEPTEEIKPCCTAICSSLLEARDYLKV